MSFSNQQSNDIEGLENKMRISDIKETKTEVNNELIMSLKNEE